MKYNWMNTLSSSALVAVLSSTALATDADRLSALEKEMTDTKAELAALKGEKTDLYGIETSEKSKFTFGGYAEAHANFVDGGGDQFDIHRLVLYLGYEFADWIRLSSEVELEHAWTDDGGYVLLEQLYVDFLLSDPLSIRVGRVLAPLGIVNQNHEPTLFFGVERPFVDQVIIPTTWSMDGAGIFGAPLSWLTYEAYAVAGLAGSGFDGSDGVRDGRLKGREGLDDPAVTGRIDFYPFVDRDLPAQQDLRIGVSGYYGGTDNASRGGPGPGNVDNTFAMAAADFQYDVSRVIVRGVVAFGNNSDAAALNAAYSNDVGEDIFGWYLEGGVSVMPDSWKTGKLKESDIIPFVRYSMYDTQHKVPTGTVKNEANDRSDVTVGVNWMLTQNFVLKADAQFMSNELVGSDVNNRYNLGMGWIFQ
ncbi:hypothetical protein P4E94_13680 [Pontiellaceae bacterium B12219]|nr:hypothetical protein [Pontiellaceae bacterium B12219]